MVERWLFFRKRGTGGEELGDELCDLLEQGRRDRGRGPPRSSHESIEAEVLRASLRWAQGGPEALAAGIDGEMTKRRRELESGMTLLGTLGNNAPFVGLLGTVIGVIVAFADLADGSNKVQMDKVMGGIAEALIATGVGLFVAIPAVVAYNVFQKKITDIEDNVSSISKRLCALLAAVGTFEDSPAPGPVDALKVAGRELPRSGARELVAQASGRGSPGRRSGGVGHGRLGRRVSGETRRDRRHQRDADGRRHARAPRHHDGVGDVHRVAGAQGRAAAERVVRRAGAGADHGDADQGRPDAASTRSPSSGDAALIALFQKARSAPGEPSLVVSADGRRYHRAVVHVIDLAKQQGITKFAISVQAE